MTKYPEGMMAYVTVERAPEKPLVVPILGKDGVFRHEESETYRTTYECRTFLGVLPDDGPSGGWPRVDEQVGHTYPVTSEEQLEVVVESIRERLKHMIAGLPSSSSGSGLRVGVAVLYSGD